MACSRFALNKLLVASTTSFVPFRAAATATNNRRGLSTSVRDIYDEPMLGLMLRKVPHTLLYTTKLIPGQEEVCPNLLSLMRNDAKLKFSLHVPGNETISYLKGSRIGIRLDLGLDMRQRHSDSFDDQMVETKIQSDVFFIKGYVQKSDIRNYYYARIDIPYMTTNVAVTNSIQTEIKDGIMNVTLPMPIIRGLI